MGTVGMIIAPLVIFGFLALVPVLDRGHALGAPRPRWLMALAVVMLVLYVGGIFYGVMAPQQQHLGM